MKKLIIIFLILVSIIGGVVLGLNMSKSEHKKNYNIVTYQNEMNAEINNKIDEEQKKELFSTYYNKANELLTNMTLEEKVGQMFFARYPSDSVNEEIKKHNPGGYILFGKDFKNETKESILKRITSHQDNSKTKMFIGVDEEGGTVVRVSLYKAFRNTRFSSPQSLLKQGGLEKLLKDSNEKSKLLKSIGINTNLTPVADIPTQTSSFIYERSFGKKAGETAKYTEELIKTMNKDNMISAMKHFPGYGDNVDTHTGIAIDKREYEEFKNNDFKPFEAGIKANGPMILVNHNIVNCMDEKLPASLSKEVHDILRDDLEFSGLVITDDLAMDAVKKYVENGEAAVQAVLAGNDMIISSEFAKQKAEVVKAVEDGKISEDIINTAVKRILACKYAYGII